MYAWILEHHPTHHDGLLAIARLDAWQGCGTRADRRYQELLRENPHDLEARCGLIDVLLWRHAWDQAERELDAGLRLDPYAAELWKRRARVYLWSHDRTRAVQSADYAVQLAPSDPEAREFRERLYQSQVRSSVRLDAAPHAYPSLFTADLQALQLHGNLEFAAQSQWIMRYGGSQDGPIVDGRHYVGVFDHLPSGVGFGAGLGFGGPSRAVPRFAPKLWILSPILPRLSGEFAYSLWQYQSPKTLHIFNPALTYEWEHFRVDLRWWSTYVVLPPREEDFATATTGWVHAVSLRVCWNPLRETMLGASYTYGPELDQNPFSYQLLASSSQTIAVFADRLLQRGFGLAPTLSLEHRRPQYASAIDILSAELAAYLRW